MQFDLFFIDFTGAVTLLNNDQLTSGADLGLLLIDTLEKSKVEDFDFWISRIAIILTKIGPTVVERENLLVCLLFYSIQKKKHFL